MQRVRSGLCLGVLLVSTVSNAVAQDPPKFVPEARAG